MDYFDDDDFVFDEDALDDEHQLTLIDETKIELLETIKTIAEEGLFNINHFQPEELHANISIISRHVGGIMELDSLVAEQEQAVENGTSGPSDEEIYAKIEEIKLSVKEMTYTDIKEFEKNQKKVEDDGENDTSTDIDPGF